MLSARAVAEVSRELRGGVALPRLAWRLGERVFGAMRVNAPLRGFNPGWCTEGGALSQRPWACADVSGFSAVCSSAGRRVHPVLQQGGVRR